MKKIVSLFTFLFFLILSYPLLAEVDIEFLKKKFPKCENSNYRHECFDEILYSNVKEIGYFRNNILWDGQYFQNDILTFEYINGEQILRSFCEEKDDGWAVCPSGNRSKAFDGGYHNIEGKKHGKFIIEFSSGDKYVGEFKNNRKHGQGTYTYSNGSKYVGEYKEGVRSGQGTYTFSDGSKDVGEWQNGALNGYAIQYNADGTIQREGIFKDDVFQYAQKKSSNSSNLNSKLNKYKEFCKEIGFKLGTEKFADCVLKVMEKD